MLIPEQVNSWTAINSFDTLIGTHEMSSIILVVGPNSLSPLTTPLPTS